jgi:predicted anti-sigma-YlaC factor YlaD
MSGEASSEITCQELVELVTEYLEGSMAPGRRLLFEEHIAFCSPCSRYLNQMRETIAITGALREEDLDPDSRAMMLRAFREFSA